MAKDTVISLQGLEYADATEEDGGLDLTPQRSLLHRVAYPPRISLNGLLISLLCTLLLVMMGFVIVSIPSPLNLGSGVTDYSLLKKIDYTFQIPVALFMAAFLGPFLGTAVIFLFLMTGLAFYPVFADGGGWHYVTEPGFGYLLGTLIAGYLLGKTFHKAFQKQGGASRSLKLVANAIAAVLLVHLAGLLYLVGLSLTGHLAWGALPGYMVGLTVETAPYDLLATFVFLCLVRQFRLGLWLVLY